MELEEHQNSHTGEKPFECDVCKARFNRRSTLWNHKRIHSDTKPFSCPICSMQFKWKNSLKCHREMHLRKNEAAEVRDVDFKQSVTYASVTGGRRQGRKAAATTGAGGAKKKKGGNKKSEGEEQGEVPKREMPEHQQLNGGGNSNSGGNSCSMIQMSLQQNYSPPNDPTPHLPMTSVINSGFTTPLTGTAAPILSIPPTVYPISSPACHVRPQTAAFLNVQIINPPQGTPSFPSGSLLTPAATPTNFMSPSPSHHTQGTFVNGYRPNIFAGGLSAQSLLDGGGGVGGAMVPPPSSSGPVLGADYVPNVDFMLQQGLQSHQHHHHGSSNTSGVICTSNGGGVATIDVGGGGGGPISTQSHLNPAPSAPTSLPPIASTSNTIDGAYVVKVLPYNEW